LKEENNIDFERQLEYFKGRSALGPKADTLVESLAMVQHHDLVSIWYKKYLVDDYAK